MTQLDKSQLQILVGLPFLVPRGKQFAENPYKSYHVYKVKVVLHIYNKSLVIRFEGNPANKNKSLILIKF